MTNSIERAKIASVERVFESASQTFLHASEIPKYVESPLVEPVMMLFNKGILTRSSTANIQGGYNMANICLDMETLSEENKKVVGEILNKPTFDPEERTLALEMPITAETPVETVTAYFVDLANKFERQPAIWLPSFGAEDLEKMYEFTPGEKTPEELAKETGTYLGADGYFYFDKRIYELYNAIE